MNSSLRQKSLEFIRKPDTWTRWPVLPVVSLGFPTRTGVILDGHGPSVYLINIFDMKKLAEADVIEYKDYDALLDEWRID